MIYKNEGYMAGANLGHWISQYGKKGIEHFDSFIVESDLARIAEWGLDHVRLPVDYFLFEDDNAPGVFDEKALNYIDNCLEWCIKYGLNMVLDLHHAPGFFFGDGDKNTLFQNSLMQERYINIWKMFSKRYNAQGENLCFELLNELVLNDGSEKWNDLWQRTVACIHEISSQRKIIVGGNFWNSVYELKNLTIVNDPRILYTFHMYSPMIFTHQAASWMENTKRYTTPVEYPVDVDMHKDFYNGDFPEFETGILDKNYLRKILEPAIQFIQENKRPLYCGEYGVIENADNESAIRWLNDIGDIFLEYGIGRAVWAYRGFSNIIDFKTKDLTDERFVTAISKR